MEECCCDGSSERVRFGVSPVDVDLRTGASARLPHRSRLLDGASNSPAISMGPNEPGQQAGVGLRRVWVWEIHLCSTHFLLLDDFRKDVPGDYLAGFPWHP
jgi:hypothetical protein